MPDEPQGDPVETPVRPRRTTPAAQLGPAPQEPAVQRFPVSRLMADPSILGASTPALAAAFADADVSDDDMLSRDEAEKLIAESQGRPVSEPEEA